MLNFGVVEAVHGSRATVAITRHTACGECGACQMGKENMERKVEANNTIGAKIGDRVTMSMSEDKVLKAAFIVYIVPLIVLIAGIFLTKLTLEFFQISDMVELYGVFVGLIGMALCFWFIKKKDTDMKKSGELEITIIQINEEEELTCLKTI